MYVGCVMQVLVRDNKSVLVIMWNEQRIRSLFADQY